MKTLFATILLVTSIATATAQPVGPEPMPAPAPAPEPTPAQPPPVQLARAEVEPVTRPVAAPVAEPLRVDAAPARDTGWGKPVGRRFLHGFRLGYTTVMNYERPTRDGNMSLKDELGLETPHMMLLGYEGFYRIIGHSWLNVLLVGNVTVAGLEQSKFIPTGSGLIGFEFDQSFQIGVGVNVTPDPQAPTHMIAAAGWTPRVGAIHTPVHFFVVPDTAGNHRMGATVGMTW